MFSGIGGFELGIRQAYENKKNRQQEPIRQRSVRRSGQRQRDISSIRSRGRKSDKEEGHRLEQWLCCGYSEINKYAIQIYEKHFNHKNYGSATTIKPTTLPDFDLLVGGFPCQAFSIAGKRGGFKDTRGTLFFDIAKVLKAKRPKNFVLENVKGLLSHDKGNTFATIIRTIIELGYDCQWSVLNSKNFGVPQNRERVFIVGHLGGGSRRQVFPIGKTNKKDIEQLNKPKHSNDRIYGEKGVSPTLNTMQGGRRQPFVLNQQTRSADRPSLQYSSGGSGLLVKENEAFCLPTSGGSGQYLLDSKIRRLTPTECERLQGFPDGWTEGVSDTQRYKTLGNAVTVNVIKAIMEKLLI